MKKVIFLLALALAIGQLGYSKELNIYLDADMSIFKASGRSIKNGIEVALDEFHKSNSNYKLNFIVLDHRGNTRRSLANFKKIKNDPQAIAVFGGLHSPPLISNKKYINENDILTLVPWAAGGPITRSNSSKNWIYRLSIDDSQAGGFISTYASTQAGCKKPALILEETGWGKSNEANMKKGLAKLGLKPKYKQFFGWGVSKSSAIEIATGIKKSQADCIFFVGNGRDAKTIFNSLGDLNIKLPIFSHWGITGGNNKAMSELIAKNGLDVSIIQTRFTFLQKKLSPLQKKVGDKILKKFGLSKYEDIKPMSGWVHSYDLAKIILSALSKVDHDQKTQDIKMSLKKELENLSRPVDGLVKKYQRPFLKYSNKNKNAHEALSDKDYVMRKYDKDGNLR